MAQKHGVLIVNLGTPSEATPAAIKHYLGEFLRDRQVVDLPPLLWLPILYGIVIPKRLKYITEHYQAIWLNNQSPLLFYCEQLWHKMQVRYPDLPCELAMTYGEPSLLSALERLKNCDTIHVISLYPQYSTTTTLAASKKINQLVSNWPQPPIFNYLYDYADNPHYIDALVYHIDQHLCLNQPDILLLSYHGIPMSYVKKRPDEYVTRCELTTHLIKQKITRYYPQLEVMMTFQSRFGKGKWTEPNTSDVLFELAKKERSVTVICPGFAVDCIETLHEIDIENRELFINAGGKSFNYIPALNDNPLQCELLAALINESLPKQPN
ncbi:ferrochelatase [Orbus hercynius]|uniref:Ferrochelatase n=1 Tax=Orbus hercynius TaxID=593135 RepID=A0A495RB94_9GAMM|nr:ferrochelatase [Orbus hercynius]RKS84444.1 ferrochelatase [Orbus hercynius]